MAYHGLGPYIIIFSNSMTSGHIFFHRHFFKHMLHFLWWIPILFIFKIHLFDRQLTRTLSKLSKNQSFGREEKRVKVMICIPFSFNSCVSFLEWTSPFSLIQSSSLPCVWCRISLSFLFYSDWSDFHVTIIWNMDSQ